MKKATGFLAVILVSMLLLAACGSGGQTPDTTAPMVNSTSPGDEETGIAVNTSVSVSFSEDVDCSSLAAMPHSFTLMVGNYTVLGAVFCSGAKVIFTPFTDLVSGTTYTATISGSVTDLAGNAMGADKVWTFTTGGMPDTTAPWVAFVSPTEGAESVAVDTNVSVTFSEKIDCATVDGSTFTLTDGTSQIFGLVACSGNKISFVPSTSLAYNTTYTATVNGNVTDIAGNAMGADKVWSFTTGTATEAIPPVVSSVDPADGTTEVAVNSNVTATFSEDVDCATVDGSTFTLTDGTSPVIGLIACWGSNVTLSPSADLAPGTTYTATISNTVTDLAGNAMVADEVWSFTTVADTTAPSAVVIGPSGTNVPVNTSIGITYDEDIVCTAAVLTLTGGITSTASCSGAIVTFIPNDQLAANTTYTVTVSGVSDLAGNAADNKTWIFTTSSAVAPLQ